MAIFNKKSSTFQKQSSNIRLENTRRDFQGKYAG